MERQFMGVLILMNFSEAGSEGTLFKASKYADNSRV